MQAPDHMDPGKRMTIRLQRREVSLRSRGAPVALGVALLAMQPAVPTWTFAESARPALRQLWTESVRDRQERVACLAGTLTEDSVVVTEVFPLPVDDADSLGASSTLGIQACGRPQFMGNVHTHIRSTDDSVPAPRFSASDRMVMSEWTRRWGGQGAFCVLYSERNAHCEVYPPRN